MESLQQSELEKNRVNAKKIHTHLQRINRLNTILAVLSLVAVTALYFYYSPEPKNDDGYTFTPTKNSTTPEQQPQTTPADAVDMDDLTSQYRTDMKTILSGYNFDDAAKAETLVYTVLELRVPPELKNFHLQVVIALNEAQQGKYDIAQQRIKSLREQFAWFK